MSLERLGLIPVYGVSLGLSDPHGEFFLIYIFKQTLAESFLITYLDQCMAFVVLSS